MGIVSVLSKLKPFGACILGWKNKVFVSEKHVFFLVCFFAPGIYIPMSFFQCCPTCKRKLWIKPEQVIDIWSAKSRESYTGI